MKRLFLLLLVFVSLGVKANHWEPNPYQFPNNMTVIGVLSFHGEEQRRDSIEVGAFCGDECRGSVITDYDENMDRYYVYMMIYGNSNDSIGFRCYDHKLDMELIMIPESYLFFQANAMIGNVMDPFVFSFQCHQHNISVDLEPEEYGSVIGDGVHYRYDTCFINLIPKEGYQVDALIEDGDTLTKQEHYSFIVLTDRHFVAHFSEKPVYYQITAEADPSSGGVITGMGECLEETDCILQISTNPGYIYEGLYENEQLVTSDTVYSFVADADRHFVAKFSVQINHYQISADVTPNEGGTILGAGIYQEGSTCDLEIVANDGYSFVALKENDVVVSEDNIYSFVVEEDRHFVAEFIKLEYYYDITADIFPENAGSMTGLGTYQEGTTCSLEIIANECYRFVALKENDEIVSEETTYSFVVEEDRHFVVEFDLQEYEVKLSANPVEGGTISGTGSGMYKYGSTIYAIATPNDNYVFLNWTDEDGNVLTSNSQYVFDVTKDVSIIANFTYVDAVSENDVPYFTIYPNPASDFITIEYDDVNQVTVYDMTGKVVIRKNLDGDNRIYVGNLSKGTYVITYDDGLTSRKLIINK